MQAWLRPTRHLYRGLCRLNYQPTRSVYIPTRVQRTNVQTRTGSHKERLIDEETELDSKISELKQQETELRKFLAAQRDAKRKELAGRELGADMDKRATDEDIVSFEAQLAVEAKLSKSAPPHGHIAGRKPLSLLGEHSPLPASIESRLFDRPSNDVTAYGGLNGPRRDWAVIITQLEQHGGLQGVAAKDVDNLMAQIPSKDMPNIVERLETLINSAGMEISQFSKDHLMGGYAKLGRPQDVERLLATSAKPTIFSFSHVAVAYFKVKDSAKVGEVLSRLNELSIEPSLPIYTTIIQSYVQSKDYDGAFRIFDNLNYLSTKTMPDTKLYNTMMLAAAKMHNVNKVLDLHTEMTTRAIKPLHPNQETLNILVYACSRDPKTRFRAWEVFADLRDSGAEVNRETINALMYLCGMSGELLIARAVIKQLFQNPATYPDNFAVNCLMMAYLNHQPGQVSQVLGTKLGPKIRAHLLHQEVGKEVSAIPLLPINIFDRKSVLAESSAMLNFFGEVSNGQLLRVTSGSASDSGMSPVMVNYLNVALAHGDAAEFKGRFAMYTKYTSSPSEQAVTKAEFVPELASPNPHPYALVRNKDIYQLGLKAAIKFLDVDFARQVWTERGAWRRTRDFQNLSKKLRDQSDAKFAKGMVQLFIASGETQEALQIIRSTVNMIRWRRSHFNEALEILAQREDYDTILEIKKLLQAYWFREQTLLRETAPRRGSKRA